MAPGSPASLRVLALFQAISLQRPVGINQKLRKAVGEGGGCSSPGSRTLSTTRGKHLADQGHLPWAGCHAGKAGHRAGTALQLSGVSSRLEDTHPWGVPVPPGPWPRRVCS